MMQAAGGALSRINHRDLAGVTYNTEEQYRIKFHEALQEYFVGK